MLRYFAGAAAMQQLGKTPSQIFGSNLKVQIETYSLANRSIISNQYASLTDLVSGIVYSQGTALNRPALDANAINNLDAALFDQTAVVEVLIGQTAINIVQPFVVGLIFKPQTNIVQLSPRAIIGDAFNNLYIGIDEQSGSNFVYKFAAFEQSVPITLASTHYAVLYVNSTSSWVKIDGAAKVNAATDPGSTGFNTAQIGCLSSDSAAAGFQGDFVEWDLATGTPTDFQITGFEAYLKSIAGI